MEEGEEHPFYGHEILRDRQQATVQKILTQFDGEPVTEELKKRIWDALQEAKQRGDVTIPFKVVMRRDASKKHPEYVEVILDTKV